MPELKTSLLNKLNALMNVFVFCRLMGETFPFGVGFKDLVHSLEMKRTIHQTRVQWHPVLTSAGRNCAKGDNPVGAKVM